MARKPIIPTDDDMDDDGLGAMDDARKEVAAEGSQDDTFSAEGAVSDTASKDPADPALKDQAQPVTFQVEQPLVLADPLRPAEAAAAASGPTPTIDGTEGAQHAPVAAQGANEGFTSARTLKGVGEQPFEQVTQPSTGGRVVAPSQPLPFDPEVEAARKPAGKEPDKRDASNDLQNVEALVPGVNIPAGPGEPQPVLTQSQRFPARPPVSSLARPHMINGFPAYDVPESERKNRAVTYPPPTEDAPVHLGITSENKANQPVEGGPGKPLHELNVEAWAIDDKHAEQFAKANEAANKVAEPMLRGVPRRRSMMRRMQKDLTALPAEVAQQAGKRTSTQPSSKKKG